MAEEEARKFTFDYFFLICQVKKIFDMIAVLHMMLLL